MSESMRLLLLLVGMAICLIAMWPRGPHDVSLGRGAAPIMIARPSEWPKLIEGMRRPHGPEAFSGRDGSSFTPGFSFTSANTMKGGVMWRDGRAVYLGSDMREITREQLRARLTDEEWRQVEDAIRKGPTPPEAK